VKVGRVAGKTPEGVFDLAGNVREWCRDRYPNPYARGSNEGLVGRRGLRGGSFLNDERYLRSIEPDEMDPEIASGELGFRVVFAP